MKAVVPAAAQALSVIAQHAETQLAELKPQVSSIVELVRTIEVIENPAHNEWAASLVKQIADFTDELEDLRTGMTKPLNDAKRAIDAIFKPDTNALSEAKTKLKRLSAAFLVQQQTEAEAKAAVQRATQLQLGLAETATAAPAILPQGQRLIYKQDFRIENLNSIPDKYWMLDEAMVKTDLEAGVSIPGIVGFKIADTVVTRR